jgi:xanthine dehydrogenase accessory factor
MKNIYLKVHDHQSSGYTMVLATVCRTNGSTPQKPGSSALFNDVGLVSGTVGGGVVEGRVQKIALEAGKTKQSGLFQFNLTSEISNPEEAICGGQISVLIDSDPEKSFPVFELIKQSISRRIPGVLITMVTGLSGNSISINRYWKSESVGGSLSTEFADKIEPLVLSMLSDGKHGDYREIEVSGKDSTVWFFLEPVFPPFQLIIAGAGHVGKALTHIGSWLNFDITVIDDRSEYANIENLPDADHIIVKDIGKAMQALIKGADTYVVIVTRGHKDDAEALKPCIGTDLAYVGMIGSKKKISTMKRSFIDNGLATEEQWNRIYTPIGLDINSQTVEEIAVSIAAQLIMVRNNRV